MKANSIADCGIVCGDSRQVLEKHVGTVNLIVTSPPYADARHKHYDSIHPDQFAEWFLTFHQPFYNALKPDGSLVINIKDKIVNGVRHRYVWHTIEALCARGWFAIDDYLWHKTNPMPGFWPTRLRDGWEYCFHLAKSPRPYFNADAVRKPIGDWVESRLTKLGPNDLSRHNSVNASGFGRNISKWIGKHTVLPSNVISLGLVGKNMGVIRPSSPWTCHCSSSTSSVRPTAWSWTRSEVVALPASPLCPQDASACSLITTRHIATWPPVASLRRRRWPRRVRGSREDQTRSQ